ncbi:MAG TPA: methyl-accepting chemotaxis protein [Williamwhitmania sp.]|nr:methyl-accepting chemotaxis protein [Williamwhitmania sp.]
MKISDTKIGTRLLASYILMAILTMVVGIFGVMNINKIQTDDDTLYKKVTLPIGEVSTMNVAFQRIRVNVRDFIFAKDMAAGQVFYDRIFDLKKQFDESGKLLEASLLTDEGKKAYREVTNYMDKYLSFLPSMEQHIKAGEVDQAVGLMKGEMQVANANFQKAMDEVVASKFSIAQNTAKSNEDAANSSSSLMVGIIVIAVVLAIILGLVVTRSITTGIGKGVAHAEVISQGNLTLDFASEYMQRKDEIGALSRAMQLMVEKLREVVTNIASGSENILSASLQMSNTSQEMSQGASEQASSAEEVSASMEEMAANIEQNTDNAQAAEKISITGAERIQKSNDAAQMSITAMREIADKVSIISDIAFQTNILALNAAVEAARAGEQGRGFAVVAAEVRKLAERSKVAAEEIERISKKGVLLSDDAGKMLTQVVPEIERAAKLVQEIAAASVEQTSGAEQVNSALQQLNQVTQQNAAASEEMATASEELASQAEQLRDVVSYFRVEEGQKAKNRGGSKPQQRAIKTAVAHLHREDAPKPTAGKSSMGREYNLADSNGDSAYEKF